MSDHHYSESTLNLRIPSVLSALVLQEEAGLGKIFYLSENLILTYYGLSFSLNVLCTLLIAVRLYYHKVQLERIFGENHSPGLVHTDLTCCLSLG